MSKTSLTVINENAAALVAGSSFEITTTHVAGFPIPAAFTGRSAWTASVEEYERQKAEIIEQLDNVGVTPIAILPEALWQRICRSSGLYILHPDSEGRVGVNVEGEMSRVETRTALLVPLVLGLLSALILLRDDTPYDHVGLFIGILGALTTVIGFGFWALGYLCAWLIPQTSHKIMSRALATIHAMFVGEVRMMQRMLDTGIRSSTRVKVKLPTPPNDVAETLAKLVGFENMFTAVEPGAVRFAETPIELLAGGLEEKWEEDAAEARRLRHELALQRARMRDLDPIIAVQHRGVVAIVAQFGDFPIEERVVQKAMKVENLKLLR